MDDTKEGLPVIWRERVADDYCDYNDHLNVAFYVLIFDHATDAFYESLGLNEGYRETSGCSTFAVEMHTNYIAEVRKGVEVLCTTQLLDFDEKRFHYFHRMYNAETGVLSATNECLGVHVDMGIRRVSPMPDFLQDSFGKRFETHKEFPKPDQQGRVMGIRRKK